MGRTSDARQRLVESSLELIHSQSYSTVSVEDLCKKAGVNKGSFYYFFPSKHALTLEALEAYWQKSKTEVLEPAFLTDIAPLARINRVFEMAFQFHQLHHTGEGGLFGCLLGNLTCELGSYDPQVRQKLQEIFVEFYAYFEVALYEAQGRGELAHNIFVPDAARGLVAYLQGLILMAKAHNQVSLIKELSSNALRMLGVSDY